VMSTRTAARSTSPSKTMRRARAVIDPSPMTSLQFASYATLWRRKVKP
jgi:hypothetical protein